MKIKMMGRLHNYGLAITAAALMTLTACEKEEATSENSVTEEEAVEVMAQGISGESGGLSTQVEGTAEVAEATPITCGTSSSDTAFSALDVVRGAITYSYSVSMNRQLVCSDGLPQEFSFHYTGENSYDAPRMSSDDNTTAGFVITGLSPLSAQYVFNANYVRNGTQQSKVRLQRSFASTLTITSTNITVDKATGRIVSGTVDVEFTGKVVGGSSNANYKGSFTFTGNRTGTLVLKNGGSYTLQW